MFWFAVVLFPLKVLLAVLFDAAKGSVAISSHLINLNFALQQQKIIWSALSRFIFLPLLVFHCSSARCTKAKSNLGSDCLLVLVTALGIVAAAGFLAIKNLY